MLQLRHPQAPDLAHDHPGFQSAARDGLVMLRRTSVAQALRDAWPAQAEDPEQILEHAQQADDGQRQRAAFVQCRAEIARQADRARQQAVFVEDIHALAEAARQQSAPKPAKTRNTGQDQPEWATNWLREDKPLERVLGGAEALGWHDLRPDGTRLPFSVMDLIKALQDYRKGTTPDYKQDTLSKVLREHYRGFEFAAGRTGGDERIALIPEITKAYDEGKLQDNDEALDQHLMPNVVRLLRA